MEDGESIVTCVRTSDHKHVRVHAIFDSPLLVEARLNSNDPASLPLSLSILDRVKSNDRGLTDIRWTEYFHHKSKWPASCTQGIIQTENPSRYYIQGVRL